MMLRLIFGLKRDANGEWRRIHNEELRSLFRSPNVISVIKFRRLGMEEGRSALCKYKIRS